MRKALFLAAAMLLSACTLTPRDTGKAYMFGLTPVNKAAGKARDEALVVAMPVTSPELDTYRISLIRNGGVRDYYAGARWAEFLPSLVQDNLTKSLENARLFKSVTTDETGLAGDMILKAEIRSFEAEYAPGSKLPSVRIRIVASLVSRVERKTLASLEANALKKVSSPDLPAIRSAFSAAFDDAQRQMLRQIEAAELQQAPK